jgi:hypothetical protein
MLRCSRRHGIDPKDPRVRLMDRLDPGGTTPIVVVLPTLIRGAAVDGMSGWAPPVSWPGGNFVAGGDEWCCSYCW